MRLGGFKSQVMLVVAACDRRIGGAARYGGSSFTDEETNSPGFEINRALAERQAASGASCDQGPPPTMDPK